MKKPPRKTVRAWALWSPDHGVIESTVRRNKSAAIEAIWVKEYWPTKRREGWRVVAVEVTAIYFSSSKSMMQKV